MSTRAVPYLCPFCGEEDLRPVEAAGDGSDAAPAGAKPRARWECRGCLRVFSLAFHGLSRPVPRPDAPLATAAVTRPWNPDAWGGTP